jgi:hypothetical protein
MVAEPSVCGLSCPAAEGRGRCACAAMFESAIGELAILCTTVGRSGVLPEGELLKLRIIVLAWSFGLGDAGCDGVPLPTEATLLARARPSTDAARDCA